MHVGLETVGGDVSMVRRHVEQLLANASGIVPAELHRHTPVYFMATAGKKRVHEVKIFVHCIVTAKQLSGIICRTLTLAATLPTFRQRLKTYLFFLSFPLTDLTSSTVVPEVIYITRTSIKILD